MVRLRGRLDIYAARSRQLIHVSKLFPHPPLATLSTLPLATVAPLDVNSEALALQEVGLLPPGEVMQGGSFDDLRAALNDFKPHLFWFSGHGNVQLQVQLSPAPSLPSSFPSQFSMRFPLLTPYCPCSLPSPFSPSSPSLLSQFRPLRFSPFLALSPLPLSAHALLRPSL